MTDDNDNKNTELPMSASEVTAGTKIVRRAANQKPSRVVADISSQIVWFKRQKMVEPDSDAEKIIDKSFVPDRPTAPK